MSDAYDKQLRKHSPALRVLEKAMRDRKHLLRTLVIGDVIGQRPADGRKRGRK